MLMPARAFDVSVPEEWVLTAHAAARMVIEIVERPHALPGSA
jgi:hypothetical protein